MVADKAVPTAAKADTSPFALIFSTYESSKKRYFSANGSLNICKNPNLDAK